MRQFCTKSSHGHLLCQELPWPFTVITVIIVPNVVCFHFCGQSALTFTVQFLSKRFQGASFVLKKHLLEKDSIHSLSTCNWVCFFCFQMGAYSHWPKNRVGTVFCLVKNLSNP